MENSSADHQKKEIICFIMDCKTFSRILTVHFDLKKGKTNFKYFSW